MMESQPVTESAPTTTVIRRGRTSDLYDLGAKLMIVAGDALAEPGVTSGVSIPGKGACCTALLAYWLKTLPACRFHDLEYVVTHDRVPVGYEALANQLSGRARVVRKAAVLPIHCAVYGYLAEFAWHESRMRGSVGAVQPPDGLRESERLPEPIFVPCEKSGDGPPAAVTLLDACDISQEFMLGIGATPGAGRAVLLESRRRAVDIYHQAQVHAEERGLLLAAATFHFGLWRNQLLLVGDVLTPNSACYWSAADHAAGGPTPRFERAPLDDYLLRRGQNPPSLPADVPAEVIAQTQARYEDLYRRLTSPAPAR